MWPFDRRRRSYGGADLRAVRFMSRLETAISGVDSSRFAFERAALKRDHIEELRRILGELLDVLADWEYIADRPG